MSIKRQTEQFHKDPKCEAVSHIYEIIPVIVKNGERIQWNGRIIVPEDIRKYFGLTEGEEPRYLNITFKMLRKGSYHAS